MKGRHILVTGGAGFIGSHLVDLLLTAGAKVRVIDDFSSGKLTNLPTDNPRLEIVRGDVIHTSLIEKAIQGIDGVVHLAAVASVQASVDNPTATHGANFIGTLNLLEHCRINGIKRFLYASSAAVYGDSTNLPIDEEEATKPLTPYAADKLAGEHYLDFFRRQHGLEPIIFRFFNVFGPRQDPFSPYSGVISIFHEKTKKQEAMTVFGDGEQTRDFIYVADLTKILFKALKEPICPQGPVNIGTGKQTSLNQVLDSFAQISNNNLRVTYTEARTGDIKHSLADISRLKEWLGHEPETPFRDGLKLLYNTNPTSRKTF